MKKIIIKILIVSCISLFPIIAPANTTSEVALIRNRLMDWAVSLPAVGDLPRKSVSEYLVLLNPDGSFSDTPADIDVMTGRLLIMAQAFKSDPKWKNNIHLKTNLYSAVQYWLNNNSGNSGWTDGCFKEPAAMDSIGLCLYDAIQYDKTNHPESAPYLDKLTDDMVKWANSAWTINDSCHFFLGANITYRLMGMIGRASLADSPEMFNDISNIIDSTFTIGKLYDTGIFADGSWHEYNVDGGQNYWLGYGRDWLNLTRKSCEYLKGTRWGLTDSQLNFMADSIIDGWQWLVYRNQGVYSLCGRHNLLKSALRDNGFMIGQIDSLKKLAGDGIILRTNELKQVRTRMANSSLSFPSFNKSKYFFKSDLMIYGRPFSYVAVKMLSNRTSGPESAKGEGKKNFHFAEGSTMIFRTGDEYLNARVGWNFRAIPGTTVEQKKDSLPSSDFGTHANGLNAFAGGISDGNYGICAFQLYRANNYAKVTANKGYFFFDNGFIALGSEIKKRPPYRNNEIWTTIDQPERKSDITYFINDKLHTIPLNKSVKLDFTNITDGAWFFCNNKGYVILPDKNGVNLKLWAENRTGDWHDLDIRYNPGDKQAVNIFQLSINHLTKPKNARYAYLVFPDITEKNLSNCYTNLPVRILENSDSVQAVQLINSNITEIAFYKPDSLAVTKSLTVSVNKPAIVMLHKFKNKLDVSISDPTQYEEEIAMNINAKLSGGTNVVWDSETGCSRITFSLPQDIFLGKSVNQSFLITPKE